MVRAALSQTRSRLNQGPRAGAEYIPAATVVAGSMMAARAVFEFPRTLMLLLFDFERAREKPALYLNWNLSSTVSPPPKSSRLISV